MIVNREAHKDANKKVQPVVDAEGFNVGFTVYLDDVEIGLATKQGDNKYRLDCINGKHNFITTNICNFIIDEMVRLYEKKEVEEDESMGF